MHSIGPPCHASGMTCGMKGSVGRPRAQPARWFQGGSCVRPHRIAVHWRSSVESHELGWLFGSGDFLAPSSVKTESSDGPFAQQTSLSTSSLALDSHVVDDPKLAFIRVLEELFHVEHPAQNRGHAHIDSSATVHPSACIHPGVVIMDNCTVGADSVLFPTVVLYPGTVVGERVRIHAGAIIGSDGFGSLL